MFRQSDNNPRAVPAGGKEGKNLPPQALRALQEAQERRVKRDQSQSLPPKEHQGRDGPDPVRYGDWEKAGIISDF